MKAAVNAWRVSCCLFALVLLADSRAAEPVVWVVSQMTRVGKTDAAGLQKKVVLYAARGDYEPFQIAIKAPVGGLSNTKVRVSSLTGANGAAIEAANLPLFREHYVFITADAAGDWGSGNRPRPPGWYADGLIPFIDPATGKPPLGGTLKGAPFNVPAGENQPIWVDLFVPRNAPAGPYSGTYTVTSDQGSITGEIELNVWDFELPLKPSLASSFLIWSTDPAAIKDMSIQLLKHRLMPSGPGNIADARLLMTHGMTHRNLGFWSGADVVNSKILNSPPTPAQVQAAVATHPVGLTLYSYTFDEIGLSPSQTLIDGVKQYGRALHQAGVKQLVTMAPIPELYDDGSNTGRPAVDIWVEHPIMFDGAAKRNSEVRAKGCQIWSYNCLTQDNYSPKWQINFTPIDFRIQPGFISQSMDLKGVLYWRVDLWTANPWSDVNTYIQGTTPWPGEGMLFYPGAQVGLKSVVPSMRLKWLREGVEDYELAEQLKLKGGTALAMQVSRSVGPDWRNWTRDAGALQTARERLGNELHRLNGGAPIGNFASKVESTHQRTARD